MHDTLRTLLNQAIDFAGLFPPAGLNMESAIRHYDSYRKGPYSWMLGRLIIPAARLAEFEDSYAAVTDHGDRGWRLSVPIGQDVEKDCQTIEGFRSRHREDIAVESVEIRADRPAFIEELPQWLPCGPSAYVEIPVSRDPTELIGAIAAAGLNAKVRTGAVTADGFPLPAQLARFLAVCSSRRVPFKATAGLHHPLRNVYRLTYEADSASTMMYGFLNIFLAAAFARRGKPESFLVALLEERSPDAFQFGRESIAFRGEVISDSELKEGRSLAVSFGSCSFEEPVADLTTLGLLQNSSEKNK